MVTESGKLFYENSNGGRGTILQQLFVCRRDTQYNEKPKVIRKLSNTRNKENMRFLEMLINILHVKIILVQRTVNNQSNDKINL